MAASGSRALYYLSDRRDLDHTGNTHARQKASKNVDCGDNLTLTLMSWSCRDSNPYEKCRISGISRTIFTSDTPRSSPPETAETPARPSFCCSRVCPVQSDTRPMSHLHQSVPGKPASGNLPHTRPDRP